MESGEYFYISLETRGSTTTAGWVGLSEARDEGRNRGAREQLEWNSVAEAAANIRTKQNTTKQNPPEWNGMECNIENVPTTGTTLAAPSKWKRREAQLQYWDSMVTTGGDGTGRDGIVVLAVVEQLEYSFPLSDLQCVLELCKNGLSVCLSCPNKKETANIQLDWTCIACSDERH